MNLTNSNIPVMSFPPSSSGGLHASVTVSCVAPGYCNGPFGALGQLTTDTYMSAESFPDEFDAVIVYLPASLRVELSTLSLVKLLPVTDYG